MFWKNVLKSDGQERLVDNIVSHLKNAADFIQVSYYLNFLIYKRVLIYIKYFMNYLPLTYNNKFIIKI
jgi:hypothetical protein